MVGRSTVTSEFGEGGVHTAYFSSASPTCLDSASHRPCSSVTCCTSVASLAHEFGGKRVLLSFRCRNAARRHQYRRIRHRARIEGGGGIHTPCRCRRAPQLINVQLQVFTGRQHLHDVLTLADASVGILLTLLADTIAPAENTVQSRRRVLRSQAGQRRTAKTRVNRASSSSCCSAQSTPSRLNTSNTSMRSRAS